MQIVTDHVFESESCYGLAEGPLLLNMPDGSTRWRWVQEVTVIRGDRKAGWRQDLGPAEDFNRVSPLLIPSFGENTVAQLQYRADKNRQDDYWIRVAEEMQNEST